jgi:hypothetical protein
MPSSRRAKRRNFRAARVRASRFAPKERVSRIAWIMTLLRIRLIARGPRSGDKN